MNEKITIPENTRVIIEDGVIIFERKEPETFNKGEWYSAKEYVLLQLDHGVVGFARGKWYESSTGIPHSIGYIKADPKEVTRLLIGEAEKKYGTTPDESRDIGDLFFMEDGNLMTNGYSNNSVVFDSKTGKWAEIIEEKKPLYVNHTKNKTEFFEGDTCYWVDKIDSAICKIKKLSKGHNCRDTELSSEIMTKKECYQYLADNCKE